jgi:hypothetical protein
MSWLLVVGVTWLLVAAAIALLVARSIHFADSKATSENPPQPPVVVDSGRPDAVAPVIPLRAPAMRGGVRSSERTPSNRGKART